MSEQKTGAPVRLCDAWEVLSIGLRGRPLPSSEQPIAVRADQAPRVEYLLQVAVGAPLGGEDEGLQFAARIKQGATAFEFAQAALAMAHAILNAQQAPKAANEPTGAPAGAPASDAGSGPNGQQHAAGHA